MDFEMFMTVFILIVLVVMGLHVYNITTEGNLTRVLKKLLIKVKSLRIKDDLDKEIDCIEKELRYFKDKKEKLQELESLKAEMESLLGYQIEKEPAEVVVKRLNEKSHIFNDMMMTSDEASELAELIIKCGGGKQ